MYLSLDVGLVVVIGFHGFDFVSSVRSRILSFAEGDTSEEGLFRDLFDLVGNSSRPLGVRIPWVCIMLYMRGCEWGIVNNFAQFIINFYTVLYCL